MERKKWNIPAIVELDVASTNSGGLHSDQEICYGHWVGRPWSSPWVTTRSTTGWRPADYKRSTAV